MLHILHSTLHKELTASDISGLLAEIPCQASDEQIIAVMTGGTEAQFMKLLQQGQLTIDKPITLLAREESNSLAASMEILSYINQHGGHGQIRINR